MHTNEIGFSLLLALPGLPNIFIPVMSGIIIDNIGARWGVFIFGIFVCLGHLNMTFAAYQGSYIWFMIASFVYNYGGASMTIANCNILYIILILRYNN